METAPSPRKINHKRGPLLYFFIVIVGVFLLCNFIGIVLVGGSILFGYFSSDIDQNISNSNSAAIVEPGYVYREYIDPDLDDESDEFVVKSLDTFHFIYKEGINPDQYIYEREFILANLQAEYERLSTYFDYYLTGPISIELTDNEDYYESKLGFDYADQIPYAGVTSSNSIIFYINPESNYPKEGLKETISHELVHLFQFNSAKDGLYNYPKWFTEGTAEYYSKGEIYPLGTFSYFEKYTNLEILDYGFKSGILDPTLASYNTSQHFVKFLSETYSDEKVTKLMLPTVPYPAFAHDFEQIFGVNANVVYENWHRLETDLPAEAYETEIGNRSYDDYLQEMKKVFGEQ